MALGESESSPIHGAISEASLCHVTGRTPGGQVAVDI